MLVTLARVNDHMLAVLDRSPHGAAVVTLLDDTVGQLSEWCRGPVMLDDMPALRDAVGAYRAAAAAFGIPWLDEGGQGGSPPLGALRQVFDVDHIAEQVIWLKSELGRYDRVLPDGAYVDPWPADPRDMLWDQEFMTGVPFHWRHQLPLAVHDDIRFMFVLAGEHEGEIWRYQIDVDEKNPVRAAPSLAMMFTEWTKGFAASAYCRESWVAWLFVAGDDGPAGDPGDALLQRGLDPFAFPVHLSVVNHEDLIRARQRECGVDLKRADNFGCLQELHDVIRAAYESLPDLTADGPG